jgi:hypothetical protein
MVDLDKLGLVPIDAAARMLGIEPKRLRGYRFRNNLAAQYAAKNGRDEPDFRDYGDAVRFAIDRAEDMTADRQREQRASSEAAGLTVRETVSND